MVKIFFFLLIGILLSPLNFVFQLSSTFFSQQKFPTKFHILVQHIIAQPEKGLPGVPCSLAVLGFGHSLSLDSLYELSIKTLLLKALPTRKGPIKNNKTMHRRSARLLKP